MSHSPYLLILFQFPSSGSEGADLLTLLRLHLSRLPMTPFCSHQCLIFSSHPTWTVRHLRVSTLLALFVWHIETHSWCTSAPIEHTLLSFGDFFTFPSSFCCHFLQGWLFDKFRFLLKNLRDLVTLQVCNIFNFLIASKSVKLKFSLWISDSYNKSHFQCFSFYKERPWAQSFFPDLCPADSRSAHSVPHLRTNKPSLFFCWVGGLSSCICGINTELPDCYSFPISKPNAPKSRYFCLCMYLSIFHSITKL